MTAAIDMTLRDFLAALGARTPSPASGSGTAIAGAIAAAVAELAARFSDEEAATAKLQALRTELAKLADEDAAAYAAFMETRSDEDRNRTIDVPLAIAEAAAAVRDLG